MPRDAIASPISVDAVAWLQGRGAADVRVDADGVIEFSARPMPQALADAVRDLLPRRAGMPLGASAPIAVALK